MDDGCLGENSIVLPKAAIYIVSIYYEKRPKSLKMTTPLLCKVATWGLCTAKSKALLK